jgi:hypothetical protein
MSSDGEGYGDKGIPFQVSFYDSTGPYLMVGHHTYPGRRPQLRIDDDEAVLIDDDAGVSRAGTHPELIDRLRHASVVRARYHVWPEGSRDMIVDVTGFDEAWSRLQELVAGAPAPSDSIRAPRR